MKAPRELAQPIVEKYLVSKDQEISKGSLNIDWGRFYYDDANIDYELPKDKTIASGSTENLNREIYSAKLDFYEYSFAKLRNVSKDYKYYRSKSDDFESTAGTIRIIGFISIFLLLVSIPTLHYFKFNRKTEYKKEIISYEGKGTESNAHYPILGEFFNHIFLILIFALIGAIMVEALKGTLLPISDSSIARILGSMIGLILIPFLLSFLALIFVQDKKKRPKTYFYTFRVIFALVLILNLKWLSSLNSMQ